jgi:hypothetical protein
MKKSYTKEQIIEAISYWTRQLKLMTESYNKCIDALINEFGHDIVTSRNFNYNLTKDDLKRIYDILNFTLFNNKLGLIRLEYWPEGFIIDKLNENAIKSGVFDQKISSIPCYGVFSAVCKDIVDKNGNITDININEEIIILNKTYLKDCIFIFAVASICHEMIHYYDRFSKEFHDKQLNASQTNDDFDSHKDVIFQQMMKEANEHGINVTDTLKNVQFKTANENARYVLERVIGENDDSQTHINANDNRYTMRAKGSRKFVFAEFD